MQRSALFLCLTLSVLHLSRVRAEDEPKYNESIVKFCEANRGKRVGGGECAHLADEALRAAGAEFTQIGTDGKRIPDSPSEGDYVWGTLIKTYSFDDKAKKLSDSDPKAKCQPGDLLQFHGVKTSGGFQYPHHTAIVQSVDDAGNPKAIFQQNVKLPKGGDERVVQKSDLNTLKIVAGKLMVYRADKPTNPAPLQFSWTNNSGMESVEFTFGGKKGKLGASNTADGYRIVWARGVNSVTIGGTKYPLANRKAYEFYTNADGQVALREIE